MVKCESEIGEGVSASPVVSLDRLMISKLE